MSDEPELIGKHSREEVAELLRRRQLSRKTIDSYLWALLRADTWCRGEGLSLDELGAEDLDRYASTLPQTRPTLMQARSALRHYWSATGRRGAPLLDLAQRVGRAGRDVDVGLAALELVRQRGSDQQGPVTTWRDAGYDPAWLRGRLVGRQLNRRTASVYVDFLRRLQRFCEAAGSSIETATAAELEAFASTLPARRSSRQQLRSAVVHYFAIIRCPDPPVWAIRVPRKPRMVCRALERDEALRLAQAALERDDRMGLAVIVGLFTGLRRFEIAKLSWSDLSPDGWLHLVGKGDVEARIPVHPVVQDYLERQRNDSPFVFPAPSGGSVHPTTVWGWVRRVAVDAGLHAVPTHVLRHTALAAGNDVTGDLRAVQDFARHAQVETTAGYTRTTAERLQMVADAIASFYGHAGEGSGDPEPILPTLSFRELIATVEGAEAVDPWVQLATAIAPRGWHLTGTLAGEGTLSLAFSPVLRANVVMVGRSGPAFWIQRLARADDWSGDYDEWEFRDVNDLVAVARLLERGLPAPEPDAGQTDGRPWVLA